MLRFLKFWKIRSRYFESAALPVWDAAGGDRNPWDKGGGYAGVIGRLSSSLSSQRFYTATSTALNIGLGATVIWLVSQQPQVEVVAALFEPSGRLHGTIVADGATLSENRASYFVGMYLDSVRKITADKKDMRSDWEFALSLSTDQAKTALARKQKEDPLGDPFLVNPQIMREPIDVYVLPETFDKETGVGTFTVTWGEIIYRNGQPSEPQRLSGVVTTTEVPPSNKDAALKNPLGLFITSINWREVSK